MSSKKTSKKPQRKAGRSSAKTSMPGWIVLLIGMLMGLAIAVFGYVNGWVPKPENPNQKPIAQSQTQPDNSHKNEDISADVQVKPKKDYDFYTTLQEMEVVVEPAELSQNREQIAQSYTIQLGAFRKIEDAESLKAQVAFIGLSAYIQAIVDANQSQWHRVRIGPFSSGRQAGVVIKNLEKNGFDSIIIKDK